MRREEEFYCATSGGGCEGYFLTYLRTNMFGNYVIQCPNCNHHHFRVVTEGLVTQDRHDEKYGTATILIGLKATYRKTPWHNDPNFRRKQLQVYGSM